MSFVLPIRIISEANIQCHWTEKHHRNKHIEKIIRGVWTTAVVRDLRLPVRVSMIRIGVRRLDDDNLAYALKKSRDVIADLIIPGLKPGQADGSDQIKFVYGQEKNQNYGLKIIVEETSL